MYRARSARVVLVYGALTAGALMESRDSIRAVFADPQLEGMEDLYQAIGAMLKDGVGFERAYELVLQPGANSSMTWVRFCVQSANGFDDPAEESKFLAVLEEFFKQHVGI